MYILLIYNYKIKKTDFITDELSNKIGFKDFISENENLLNQYNHRKPYMLSCLKN